ncbi:MAG: hypothetical protein RMJ31_06155 [Nitrososphaerota archaeon]|nr:DUF4157 domain-containing protein [Nitrososphaerales archaeon]MDW8045337.1 hypothetical protein [Nitrososphaerota archaeon]
MNLHKARIFVIVSVTIILTLTLFLILSSKPLQIEEDGYIREARALFKDVMEGLVKVRGLPFTDSANLHVVSIEWVKENWGRRSLEAIIKEVMVEEEIYKALLLIPENVSLVKVRVEQSGWILAATIGYEVYIVRDYFELSNEARAREIFAHELTHVLQGMHFQRPNIKFHDEKQAWTSLIEGDAILTTRMYMAFWKSSSTTSISSAPKDLSKSFKDPLREIWLFPYEYGKKFVEKIFEYQGWDGVNGLYRRVPRSTTEIMHPEKYLQGWRFVEVDLVKLDGWEQVRVERFGEHFILVMLGTHMPIERAMKAAEGWMGDKFIYYKKDGNRLFLWRIVWESEEDGIEFEGSFNHLMRVVKGVELAPNYWKLPKQYIYIVRRGPEVFIIGSSIEVDELLKELSIQKEILTVIAR